MRKEFRDGDGRLWRGEMRRPVWLFEFLGKQFRHLLNNWRITKEREITSKFGTRANAKLPSAKLMMETITK